MTALSFIELKDYIVKRVAPFIVLMSLLGLVACGGGGSDAPSPTPTIPPPSGGGGGSSDPDPVNVNSENPTLKLFDNNPVSDVNNMTLVWSEEFDDTRLDPETWFFEKGDGSQYGLTGWGNNELQWYLEDNARIDNGILVIDVKEEASNGRNYTSARLHTRDRIAVRYGRIEARMKLPAGQGMWPAFWMLPQEDAYGTWAASGEIDIMEAVNLGVNNEYKVLGTIHYGGEWPNNVFSGNELEVTMDNTVDFHEYAFEWDVDEMRWYVDGQLYSTKTNWSTPNAPFPAPFDETFYILLNVAVGGNLPGSPDSTTVFPQTMEVDYVRVYSGN
ncbi:MAG: glycoside hydrolase family 16 protein [Gammaproteobacteria bacterium]|nr:glycoside hydrolase family 16 protein [Gammaproteobacteria bacterium]NNC97585.1 glycoside hydrolase family 16 protein [Gammaproteobacteria bacterium]NNM14798.1 glycoside hydrolase family 16 protein [Gammaproteobacteria bacterium]